MNHAHSVGTPTAFCKVAQLLVKPRQLCLERGEILIWQKPRVLIVVVYIYMRWVLADLVQKDCGSNEDRCRECFKKTRTVILLWCGWKRPDAEIVSPLFSALTCLSPLIFTQECVVGLALSLRLFHSVFIFRLFLHPPHPPPNPLPRLFFFFIFRRIRALHCFRPYVL